MAVIFLVVLLIDGTESIFRKLMDGTKLGMRINTLKDRAVTQRVLNELDKQIDGRLMKFNSEITLYNNIGSAPVG